MINRVSHAYYIWLDFQLACMSTLPFVTTLVWLNCREVEPCAGVMYNEPLLRQS